MLENSSRASSEKMYIKQVVSIFLCLPVLIIITGAQLLPHYQQHDYIVKFERVEIIWFNQSYADSVHVDFPWINRQHRVLNGSARLLFDQKSREVVGEAQFYKFLSNEYRFFPITISTNLCNEFDANRFHVKDMLKNVSNMHGCLLKKGVYYVHNLRFDSVVSQLPPFIPRGRYKIVGKLYYAKQHVAEAHGYGEVADLPFKWN